MQQMIGNFGVTEFNCRIDNKQIDFELLAAQFTCGISLICASEAHLNWSFLSVMTTTNLLLNVMLSKCIQIKYVQGVFLIAMPLVVAVVLVVFDVVCNGRSIAFGLGVITFVTRARDKSQINQHSQTWCWLKLCIEWNKRCTIH